MKNYLIPVALSAFFLGSCASSEIGESKDVSQDKIYQDFRIDTKEQSEDAKFYCQFRFAGNKGTTLVLSKPAQVTFDGELLRVDSTGYSGAFYLYSKFKSNLIGAHSIEYTDINGKKLTNDFTLSPLVLNDLPEEVTADKDLVISFDTPGFGGDDYVKISSMGSDSSFSAITSASENKKTITISAKDLARQPKSEIQLVGTLQHYIPLKAVTSEGGQISFEYDTRPYSIRIKK